MFVFVVCVYVCVCVFVRPWLFVCSTESCVVCLCLSVQYHPLMVLRLVSVCASLPLAHRVGICSSLRSVVLPCKNEYVHITLYTGAGVRAHESNYLPQRVESGSATRVPLPSPLELCGTLTAHM